MRKKMRKKFIWQAVLIYVLIVVLLFSSLINQVGSFNFREGFTTGPVQEMDEQSLRMHAIADSINAIEQLRRADLTNKGNFITTGMIGFSRMTETFSRGDTVGNNVRYFVCLANYELSSQSEYFNEGGRYFIRYTVWDGVNNKMWHGHAAVKEIPVRFVAESAGNDMLPVKGSVFIPVSRQTYLLSRSVIISLGCLLALFTMYMVIIIPLKVLRRLSKGDSFNVKNGYDLQSLGWYLIALGIFLAGTPFILNSFFSTAIPSEIHLSFFEIIARQRTVIIAGLVILLIARAFRRGYEMEKELAAMM